MTTRAQSTTAPPRAPSTPACGLASPHSAIRNPQSAISPRSGLTLIEMLVALAVTMVMMAAVVNLFANISGSIRNRRAVIEVSSQLRQVRQRLSRDLAGATCEAEPWQRPGENAGYIEIIEGQWSDANPSILTDGIDTASNPELNYATSLVPSSQVSVGSTTGNVTDGSGLGDYDDILALTVRSEAELFVTTYDNGTPNNTADDETYESNEAEVVWYARQNGTEPGMRQIYRRVYLIYPNLTPGANRPGVSMRQEGGTGPWIANTRGDLTKRENRAARQGTTFPFPMNGAQLGEDAENLMLGDALAFDVRVFDPGAPLLQGPANTILQPGDRGWPAATAASSPPVVANAGAFVDLGWAAEIGGSTDLYWPRNSSTQRATVNAPLQYLAQLRSTYPGLPAPVFHVPHQVGWHSRNRMLQIGYPAVYDTWSYHYENDGIVQFGGTPDIGSNGLDDAAIYDTPLDQPSSPSAATASFGVDDIGESETSPPYNFPLTGIKVILRVYEPDARQVRETSVTHSF